MKVHLNCFQCDKSYYIQDSDAIEPSMFCSKICESETDEQIAEGNKLINAALVENPAAFAKTINLNPMDSTGSASFTGASVLPTAQKEIISIVDDMFKRVNSHD